MAYRYDYRNDYKQMGLEELKNSLENEKQNLLNWIGLNDTESKKYLKRVCYLEVKIKNYKH